MIAPPSEVGVEEILGNLVLWLKLVIEAIGALIIGIGMILASLRFARGSFPPTARDFTDARLTLARWRRIFALNMRRAGALTAAIIYGVIYAACTVTESSSNRIRKETGIWLERRSGEFSRSGNS